MRIVRALGMAASMSALVAAPALAQQKGSRDTRDYVAEAAQSDTFETMAAASALAGSDDPAIAAFARMMIRDHGTTSAALQHAAAQAGLDQPPMQMSTGQAAFLAALQSARGAAFNRLYWHQQALAHRAALVVTQAYASHGDDAAVRQAAAQAVPVIEAHLAIAEREANAAPDR